MTRRVCIVTVFFIVIQGWFRKVEQISVLLLAPPEMSMMTEPCFDNVFFAGFAQGSGLFSTTFAVYSEYVTAQRCAEHAAKDVSLRYSVVTCRVKPVARVGFAGIAFNSSFVYVLYVLLAYTAFLVIG